MSFPYTGILVQIMTKFVDRSYIMMFLIRCKRLHKSEVTLESLKGVYQHVLQ